MSKVYRVEVGLLLDKEDSEYSAYNNVFDRLNAYYDEGDGFFEDLEEAKAFAKSYVKSGMNGTYGIVSDLGELPEDMVVSDKKLLFKDDSNDVDFINAFDTETLYGANSVVYSVRKVNDKLEEDFVNKPTKENKSMQESIKENFNVEEFANKVMNNLKADKPIEASFEKDGKKVSISVTPIGTMSDLMFKVIISLDGMETRDFAEDRDELVSLLKETVGNISLEESVEDSDDATHIVYLYPIKGGYQTFPVRVHAKDYDSDEDIVEKAIVKTLEDGDESFVVKTDEVDFDDYEDSDQYFYIDLTPYGFDTYFIRADELRIEDIE